MRKRRITIKGEGSITEVERGKVYRIRLRLPPTEPGGKRRWSPMRTVNGDKTAARREMENYREELEAALNGEVCEETVGHYARAFHARRANSGSLAPTTVSRERIEIEKITGLFGKISLSELDATEIERGYDRLRARGASPNEVHMVHATLSQMLQEAVNKDLIPKNPALAVRDAKRPKPRERESLTIEQAVRLASDLRDAERDGRIVAVWIALATGARRGEVLGITWRDVDLDGARIYINKQLDVRCRLRSPKSEKSVRNLSIDDGTVRFLREWREIQSRECFGGASVPDDAPVCSNLTGGFLDPNVFSRWRREWFADHGLGRFEVEERYTDKHGVTRIRRKGYVGFNLHELRHTQATLLIGSGTDLKTVQARLGHSSAQLTMNIYAHAIAQNDQRAASTIGGMLFSDGERGAG